MSLSFRINFDHVFGVRRCPFCVEPAPKLFSRKVTEKIPALGYGKSKVAQNRTVVLWQCPKCQVDFVEEKQDDGSIFLEPQIPLEKRSNILENLLPSTPIKNNDITSQFKGGICAVKVQYDNGLCARCNHYQEVMLHLLLAYEGPAPEDYRRSLDLRYPLCATCQWAVKERLKRVAYQVKMRLINRSSATTTKSTDSHKSVFEHLFFAACIFLVRYFSPSLALLVCVLYYAFRWSFIAALLIVVTCVFDASFGMAAFFMFSLVELFPCKPETTKELLEKAEKPSFAHLSLGDSGKGNQKNSPQVFPKYTIPIVQPTVKKMDNKPCIKPSTYIPPDATGPALSSLLQSFSLDEEEKATQELNYKSAAVSLLQAVILIALRYNTTKLLRYINVNEDMERALIVPLLFAFALLASSSSQHGTKSPIFGMSGSLKAILCVLRLGLDRLIINAYLLLCLDCALMALICLIPSR